MSLLRDAFLALSKSQRIQHMMTRFGPARLMARRFVAGETLAEAIAAVQALNAQGIRATLDHLGENVTSEIEARDATREILDLLEAIETHDLNSGISVKLTQLGLDLGPALAVECLESIVNRAAQAKRFVRIDMESSDYVAATLDLFRALFPRYPNLGVVIQTYLYRSAGDVAQLIDQGASVRLVKGAYDEPPEVAYPDKKDTDANFVRLMDNLFNQKARDNGVFLAIATHDSNLIEWAKQHTQKHSIAPDQFEFQMLYGIRTKLQQQLVSEGYRVRAYVPYGRQWYPYFMRRLAERPANLLFLLRNLWRS